MHEEAIIGEALPIAQAAHNHNGIVIAQVQRVLDQPLAPHNVHVPGVLVDQIVIADPEHHPQTFGEMFNESYFTPAKSTAIDTSSIKPMPLDQRRIIAARALDEIPEGAIVNLGIGMPEGIARVAAERDLLNHFTLTVESGPIGGMPAGGLSFGASVHPHAIIDQPAMFDFYDGQGLDYAALGAAQIDAHGNVNVSRFGSRLAGVGGFINITQTAKRLVFCGTFTADGLKVAVNNGSLQIVNEGKVQKFIPQLEQVSFSAKHCLNSKREALYITERAVFKLVDNGLKLIELAPGIDLQKDILDQMAFKPIIEDFKPMPPHLFIV
jgi:propionate CoA-transferase